MLKFKNCLQFIWICQYDKSEIYFVISKYYFIFVLEH